MDLLFKLQRMQVSLLSMVLAKSPTYHSTMGLSKGWNLQNVAHLAFSITQKQQLVLMMLRIYSIALLTSWLLIQKKLRLSNGARYND